MQIPQQLLGTQYNAALAAGAQSPNHHQEQRNLCIPHVFQKQQQQNSPHNLEQMLHKR